MKNLLKQKGNWDGIQDGAPKGLFYQTDHGNIKVSLEWRHIAMSLYKAKESRKAFDIAYMASDEFRDAYADLAHKAAA